MGHISKFKPLFWTVRNSIFHKLYLRCIAMGWTRSATATAACRCFRKKTFSGASIEHSFHVLPCIYNYLEKKCVKLKWYPFDHCTCKINLRFPLFQGTLFVHTRFILCQHYQAHNLIKFFLWFRKVNVYEFWWSLCNF